MPDPIRIGTRESQLAVWQATQVSELLTQNGFENELLYIKSEGDINLTTPLYEIGVQGIFTRTLDIALLNKQIDIAVHSMKDVPVVLPKGIVQAAVLERGNHSDILVLKEAVAENEFDNSNTAFTIATSSIRRKAQWLYRYPASNIENLRGNVNTRMRKLEESQWTGAIFAAAGLERIGIKPPHTLLLNWMLPAPAQGAVMVVCREEDEHIRVACDLFNDKKTAGTVLQERLFLKTLMGGCTAPISALAVIENDRLYLKGSLLSVDGRQKLETEISRPINEAGDAGILAAREILAAGGDKIMEEIRKIVG
ncbi:MAG: hydroxymethylbilane synthase [Ferruginibacter sp.]